MTVVAACTAVLAILCWESANYILEWRETETGIRHQRLYQTYLMCRADRDVLVAGNTGARLQIGYCDRDVWLPWELRPERTMIP